MILLAFALTGAPFGMGRMMDTAHGAQFSQHPSAPQGHDLPAHDASAPHYMACAACAAAAPVVANFQLMVLQGALEAAIPNAKTGIISVPLTPPPRG